MSPDIDPIDMGSLPIRIQKLYNFNKVKVKVCIVVSVDFVKYARLLNDRKVFYLSYKWNCDFL